MASQSFWCSLDENNLIKLIKGVHCPECEKQWLGHFFNGARWCADCGHSFYGSLEGNRVGRELGVSSITTSPVVVAQGPRYRYRPTADLPRTDGWRERFAERIQRDASRPAFSTQWDEPSRLTLEADREQILRDASQRAQRR
jgi:hypothetical protein